MLFYQSNYHKYMKYFVFALSCMILFTKLENVFCQTPMATIKNYYPYSEGAISTVTFGIGKQKPLGSSIGFYIVPLQQKIWNGSDSVDIAYHIFEIARKVWNDENFGFTINNLGFASNTDSLGKTKGKNIFGFGNSLSSSSAFEYGAAAPQTLRFVKSGKYEYSYWQDIHVEMNIDLFTTKLILGTPTQNDVKNVYNTAIHELGHALGLGDNVADTSSIMNYDYDEKKPFIPALGIIDKRLIRALYPSITSGRENETCLPR
jgi:hypothetical protein